MEVKLLSNLSQYLMLLDAKGAGNRLKTYFSQNQVDFVGWRFCSVEKFELSIGQPVM